MTQPAKQFSDILLEDIKGHPEVITDLLFDQDDISLLLEKRGNIVRLAYMRQHRTDTTIISEARQEPAHDSHDHKEAVQNVSISVSDHPFFGMQADSQEPVATTMERLRRGRYHAI